LIFHSIIVSPTTAEGVQMKEQIEELRRYIHDEHKGDIHGALESVGRLKRVRAVLGLPDHATLDPALYHLQNLRPMY